MATIYVASTGNDAHPGTFKQPKLTISEATRSVGSGDIVYVLNGTYQEAFLFTNTTRTNRVTWLQAPKVVAYPGHTVTLISTINAESRTLAYFRLQGYDVVHDPANYAGVSLVDVASRRDEDEGWEHILAYSLGGTEGVSSAPADLTRPTATITSHYNGLEVYGSTTVEAAISDDVAVASSWLKLDGETVRSEQPGGACIFSWDTTKSLNGEHTLQVFVKDTTGNVGISTPVWVIVSNVPPVDPDPSIVTPAIVVTCPNGIELWQSGIEVDITWTSVGIEGNLDVYLVRDGLPPEQLFANLPNTGTVTWAVSGRRAPHCHIRIESRNHLSVVGISNEFKVV